MTDMWTMTNDGLDDVIEINQGTNPLMDHTDGDGFTDSEEVDAGSDPLGAASIPAVTVSILPPIAWGLLTLLLLVIYSQYGLRRNSS